MDPESYEKQAQIGEHTPDPFDRIERLVKVLGLATALLYVVLALLAGVAYYEIRQVVNRNTTALKGLCELRSDLEVRIASSRKFLKEHPNSLPGIPAATIQQSISNMERTLKALDVVRCPPHKI